MKLHLEPVTAQNREEILRLGVLPGQKGYIETVAQCMEEAGEYGGWRRWESMTGTCQWDFPCTDFSGRSTRPRGGSGWTAC